MPNWASVARLLRRRLVLGIIFALSLTYCAISLLSHEKLGSSLKRIRVVSDDEDDGNMRVDDIQDSRIADYNENGDEIFRGSAKSLDWPLQADNNYETENEDSVDAARTTIDSNGTVVSTRMCRNSVQGKALIVDERGYVCARSELSPKGCCSTEMPENEKGEPIGESLPSSKRKRYSCETCNQEGCCAIYEYCVSCCLQPGRRRKKDSKNIGDKEHREISKTRRSDDAIKLRLRGLDRFQICLAACRTSSASVRHENTYKDPDSKHCYPRYQRYRPDESLFKNNNGDNSHVVVASSSTLRLLIRRQSRLPVDEPSIPYPFLDISYESMLDDFPVGPYLHINNNHCIFEAKKTLMTYPSISTSDNYSDERMPRTSLDLTRHTSLYSMFVSGNRFLTTSITSFLIGSCTVSRICSIGKSIVIH